jgi:hypothetical protein
MGLMPEQRVGIFLIVISLLYGVNLEIFFNKLDPTLTIPGSVIFVIGLWLLLSPPLSAAQAGTYIPVENPEQVTTEPAETVSIPVSEPKRKSTRRSKSTSPEKD